MFEEALSIYAAVDSEDQLQFKDNYLSLHKDKVKLDSSCQNQWLTVLTIAGDQDSVPTTHMEADKPLMNSIQFQGI